MDILQYIDKIKQNYGNEPVPVRYNTQKYLRPGFRGAGLVDHGPAGVRQGYAVNWTPEKKAKVLKWGENKGFKEEQVWEEFNKLDPRRQSDIRRGVITGTVKLPKPLTDKEQVVADALEEALGRPPTVAEKSKIRTGKITKDQRFYEIMDEKSWKKITDRIKKLRLQKNNKSLPNEEFAKKLNDVYKIKTKTGTTWDKSLLANLQQDIGISQQVGAPKVKRPLAEVKKIIRTLKTGEQILKDFDAGKISEDQLRKKATSKIHIEKPETQIRLEKWKKENPEIVRAMEEKKQLKTWYKEKRAFPRISKNAKSNIWANLYENVRKKRGRIELIDDSIIYEKDGTINWKRAGKNGKPNWQNVKFKDKVKNAIFRWDNLEKKVDNVFGENAYKRFAFPYEAKNQLTGTIINYKGEQRSVGSVLNEALLKKHYKRYARPGETFDAFKKRKAQGFGAFEANHMYTNDPWQTQLTFRDSNRELSYLDDTFQKELRMAADDPQKIKSLTKNFINEVKALPGGIEWNIGDQMVGKKPSLGSVAQAAFGEADLIQTYKANLPQLKNAIKIAQTAKGPAKLKAIQMIVGTIGTAAAASLFDKFGIQTAMADTGAAASGVTAGDFFLAGAAPLATKKGRSLYGKAAKAALKSASTVPGILAIEAGVGPGIVASTGGTFGEAIASPLLLEGTIRDKRIYEQLRKEGYTEDQIQMVKDSVMLRADTGAVGLESSMLPLQEMEHEGKKYTAGSPELANLAGVYDKAAEVIAEEDRARLERADKFDYLQLARGGIANLTRTVAPDSGPMHGGLRSLYNRARRK